MLSNDTREPDTLIHLRSDDQSVTATVDCVGATIRSASVNGTAIVQDWARGATRPFFAGATLFPWPNRIRDAKWSDGQTEHQLEVTEPDRHTALHGLVADTKFQVTNRQADWVTLHHTLQGAPGYPFRVSLEVTYRLIPGGVECEYRSENLGDDRAPVAIGAHPFVQIGEVDMRALTISAPVTQVITVDQRLLPVGIESVRGNSLDLTHPTALHTLSLDHGFLLDPNREYLTFLRAPDGRELQLWQSPTMPWLQAFTTDGFPGPGGTCSALALEPMTAPADALNSGTNLRWLEPGEKFHASWSLTLHSGR